MDTSKFTKRIRIKCLPEEAFEKWVTVEGLQSWFLTRAEFSSGERAEAGASFNLEWAEGTKDRGEITVLVQPANFEFSWYDGQGRVRVHFSPVDTGTLIELTHTVASMGEQHLEEYVDCRDGWTFYLANLKSVIEGGLDLRETNVDLPGLVNV